MEGCLRLNTGLNHDSNTVSHSEEWHTDIGWHIPLQQAKSMAKERSHSRILSQSITLRLSLGTCASAARPRRCGLDDWMCQMQVSLYRSIRRRRQSHLRCRG